MMAWMSWLLKTAKRMALFQSLAFVEMRSQTFREVYLSIKGVHNLEFWYFWIQGSVHALVRDPSPNLHLYHLCKISLKSWYYAKWSLDYDPKSHPRSPSREIFSLEDLVSDSRCVEHEISSLLPKKITKF